MIYQDAFDILVAMLRNGDQGIIIVGVYVKGIILEEGDVNACLP